MTPAEAAAATDRLRENTLVWEGVLSGPAAHVGPAGATPLDRAVRVRDAHLRACGREAGTSTDPAEVAADLALAADELAARVDAGVPVDVEPDAHLATVEAEVWACRHEVTVAAYDAAVEAYRDAGPPPGDTELAAAADLADRLGRGARVLEVGTGGGRDALLLEEAGLSVRRTDVTPGFVRLLRGSGHDADVLDPLTDDLLDPARPGTPYDAVWANACLLHVARADLPAVLARLTAASRAGGLLRVSLKEGDGERWSTHGSLDLPRTFTYWREDDLVAALAGAGWRVEVLERSQSRRGERWLATTAVREEGPR